MKIGTTTFWPVKGLPFLVFFLTIFFTNCQDGTIDVPTKDEFTKDKREAFGKMLANEVFGNFEFLPNLEPYDSLYWYSQTLYSQATSIMHLDKQSPVDNRWDADREWKVSIIDDDEMKHAFSLPGGDFFISTGMLKSFEREHELYFVLTFEATLMNERLLLDRLIEEYNSLTIKNLIDGRPTGNTVTLGEVAAMLPELDFSENAIKTADKETVESICQTSTVEPTGINALLLDHAFQNAAWLYTRPSYSDRPNRILNIANGLGDCGGSTGMGNYQKFVLDVLD